MAVGYWSFVGSSSQYLEVTSVPSDISSLNQFTYLAAVRIAEGNTGTILTTCDQSLHRYAGLTIDADTNDNVSMISLRNSYRASTKGTVSFDTWMAVGGICDNGDPVQVWLDGATDGSATGGNSMADRERILVGRNDLNANGTYYMTGDVSIMCLVQGILTGTQIDEWATGGSGGSILDPTQCSWATDTGTGKILAYWDCTSSSLTSTINSITCTFTNRNTATFTSTGGPTVDTGSSAITGTGAITLPSLTVAATGDVLIDGAGAVTLPSVTVAATGDVPRTADGAITLPALTVAASGSVVVTCDGSVTLPSLTVAGTGTVLVDGAGAVTLPSLTAASTGTVLVDGAGALALPSLSVSASGDVPRTGDSAITLPLLTVAGTGGGSPQIAGDGALVLPSLTVASSGLVPRTGDGAVTMPVLTVAGTGSVLVSGDGAVTLPALVVAGVGGGVVTGTGAVTLPLLSIAGSAYTSRTGDGAVIIPVLFVTARDVTSFTEHLEDTLGALLYDFPNDCLRVHWYETDQWISVDWSQCETAMDATDIGDVTATAKTNIRFVMRGIPEMRFDWDGSEDAYEPTDDPTFTLTESDLTT